MSADEIRNLAEEVGSGETSNADLRIAEALLDYADMVERCEERHSDPYGIRDEDYNYILKGEGK